MWMIATGSEILRDHRRGIMCAKSTVDLDSTTSARFHETKTLSLRRSNPGPQYDDILCSYALLETKLVKWKEDDRLCLRTTGANATLVDNGRNKVEWRISLQHN